MELTDIESANKAGSAMQRMRQAAEEKRNCRYVAGENQSEDTDCPSGQIVKRDS